MQKTSESSGRNADSATQMHTQAGNGGDLDGWRCTSTNFAQKQSRFFVNSPMRTHIALVSAVDIIYYFCYVMFFSVGWWRRIDCGQGF